MMQKAARTEQEGSLSLKHDIFRALAQQQWSQTTGFGTRTGGDPVAPVTMPRLL